MKSAKAKVTWLDNAILHRCLESHKTFRLKIVQHPVEGRSQSGGSRKNCKTPLDPPPIIELTTAENDPEKWMYIHNPNWFCTASLELVESDKNKYPGSDNKQTRGNLSGQLASSLHKVKSPDDKREKEHGFFAFGDLVVRDPGVYRLKFTLFEICRDPQRGDTYASEVHSVKSGIFKVHSGRGTLHHQVSSELSKALAESGVKLRIKKEATRRRAPITDWSATPRDNLPTAANSLHLAPVPQMPPPAPNSRSARNSGIDVSNRITARDDPLTSTVDPRIRTSPPQSSRQYPMMQQPPQQQQLSHQMMGMRGGGQIYPNHANPMMQYTTSPIAMTQGSGFPSTHAPYTFSPTQPQEAMWANRNHSGSFASPHEGMSMMLPETDGASDEPVPKRSRDSGYGQSMSNQSFMSPMESQQMNTSQGSSDSGYAAYPATTTLPMHHLPSQMDHIGPNEIVHAGRAFEPFGRPMQVPANAYAGMQPAYNNYQFQPTFPMGQQPFYNQHSGP